MNRRDWIAAAGLSALSSAHAQRAALPPGFSHADRLHADKLAEMAMAEASTGGQAWALLQQLCNEVGARPAGSAGDVKAAAWAQAAMRKLGLQNVRAESFPLRVWQRGPASAKLVAPVTEPLVMTALGNSVAAPAGGIEAEVAWYASIDALKADTTERAKGRIVFIDQKTERFKDGRGYGVAVQARFAGPTEAAKRGALALAIRSIGTDNQRIAHTGATRYEVGVPRIPAFAVSAPDADRLAALQAEGKTLRLQFTLEAKSDVEATSQNVIGEVPGSDLAGEIVAIGGHLDSWDLGVGAQDDGAGVAITMAAAALIQRAGQTPQTRPRRTVRVVLYGNEENGFDGAMAYGDRYKDQTHQLIAESDFGAGRVWQMKSRIQPQAEPLAIEVAQALFPLGVLVSAKGINDGNPGPDAAMLMRRHRWPAWQLSQDGSQYFDIHHTVHDTLDRIEPAALSQNTACWAVLAWLAAQSPLPFGPPVL